MRDKKTTKYKYRELYRYTYTALIIVMVVLVTIQSAMSITAGVAHNDPLRVYAPSMSPTENGRSMMAGQPIGIADNGGSQPFNTSEASGNALIYYLHFSTSTAVKSISVNLVGVLEAPPNHYYMLEESLTLNQTTSNEYNYELTDELVNLSSSSQSLSANHVSGSGAIHNTPKGQIYSYTLKAKTPITVPFKYTPLIKVTHTATITQIGFYVNLSTPTPAATLYTGRLDLLTISGSNQGNPTITVGGSNQVGANLLELVLSNTTDQPITLSGIDGYLQLFYQKSGSLQPIPEAVSQGAYMQSEINGVDVYPIYSHAAPLALLSSTLTNFEALWPLNYTTIALSVEKEVLLKINNTDTNLEAGTYLIPQYTHGEYIENIVTLTPTNTTNVSVKLNAPEYIQPQKDSRGVFTGWNNTYKSYTLQLNLTRPTTISVAYKPQYLAEEVYIDQYNSSVIGTQGEWVNAYTTTTIRLPPAIYVGHYTRYVYSSAELNGQTLNTTRINVTVNAPLKIMGLYEEQFLISFKGQHQNYYTQLDTWTDAFTQINLSLPQYIRDGPYARLAFESYTLGNKTYQTPQLSILLLSPVNITLNYTQQYQVNYTGPYSAYFYNLSGWYNQGQSYFIMIPYMMNVSTTFRLAYNYSIINKTIINTTYFTGKIYTPVMIQLVLVPQYLVTISAPNISIHEFFNKGQTISLHAPYYAGNIFKLDIFKEWSGTINTTSLQLTIYVNGPIHEIALYRTTYIRLLLISLFMFTVAVATVILYVTSRRRSLLISEH